jgi:hypothetical protein
MNEELKHLHHWDVLALACIDGRFIKKTIDWVSEKTNGVFDFRTEVGSSKAIIDSVADRERFFAVIDTSLKLHSIKEVWLIDHIDCGAYGGSKEFENTGDEIKFHQEKLDTATEIVSQSYPDLLIKKIFVNWDEIEEM